METCKELPQVALEFMNTVHCEELLLTRELLKAVKAGEESEVSRLLDAWLEHTIQHFEREERLMQEYRFPPFPVHQNEHRRALGTLHTVRARWQQEHDFQALESYIRDDWEPWLGNHIGTMDRVTASYLSQFNIKVDLTRE